MMCYNDNQAIYTIEKIYPQGIKSILCGFSIGEKDLTPRKLNALKKFSILYARESLTADFLKSKGFNNIICYPDPAFILEPQKTELPLYFNDSEIVGLNISKMVINNTFSTDLDKLINYILKDTNLSILLIPHVLWKNQDDRILCNDIYNKYKSTKRVYILDSKKYNYCEIRYIISNCKLFIGARTHSIISAYSTCTPALALGYSIKSRGIAKDLGLNDKLIINCIDYNKDELLSSFQYLLQNEYNIKNQLESVMGDYKKRLLEVKDVIKTLLK